MIGTDVVHFTLLRCVSSSPSLWRSTIQTGDKCEQSMTSRLEATPLHQLRHLSFDPMTQSNRMHPVVYLLLSDFYTDVPS